MSKYELIDNNNGTTTVIVPVIVPNKAIEIGGFELFAKYFGWEEKVIVNDEETGEPIEVDNPISAIDKAGDEIRKFVSDVFTTAFVSQAEQKAREEARKLASQILEVK